MRKATKVWLIIGAALVLAGCVIFTGVMTGLKWDFTKLSTMEYETSIYEISRNFEDISIDTDTADIVFVLSEDGVCKVECYEATKAGHDVFVEDGVLTIRVTDGRNWYDHIGLNITYPRITVYLPATELGTLVIREATGDVEIPKDFSFQNADVDLSTGSADFGASVSAALRIESRTGDISVKQMSAGSLELAVTTGRITAKGVSCRGDVTVKVSTGKMNLADLVCENLTATGSTGDMTFKNVTAVETISVCGSTVDVKLDGCDAGALFVETDTGDVTGSLLTDKIFAVHTDTGSVDVPPSGKGGRCEITTDTGDIKITVKGS